MAVRTGWFDRDLGTSLDMLCLVNRGVDFLQKIGQVFLPCPVMSIYLPLSIPTLQTSKEATTRVAGIRRYNTFHRVVFRFQYPAQRTYHDETHFLPDRLFVRSPACV